MSWLHLDLRSATMTLPVTDVPVGSGLGSTGLGSTGPVSTVPAAVEETLFR